MAPLITGTPHTQYNRIINNINDQSISPHLDQQVFTVRVGYRGLHNILSEGFGPGRISRSYAHGRFRWGMQYSAGVWCSKYRNIHGYCYICIAGTRQNLSILGELAAKHALRLHLYSLEIAFDIPCHDMPHALANIYRSRLANSLAPRLGQKIRRVNKSGHTFQFCSDGATNGKHTSYFHSLDESLLVQNIFKRGQFIGHTSKIYCKRLDGVWHIRIEALLFRKQIKKLIPVLPKQLDDLCEVAERLSFSDFWALKRVDYQSFEVRVMRLARREWSGSSPAWERLFSLLKQVQTLPFVEARASMREIAILLDSTKLANTLHQHCLDVGFEEVMATPLPGEPCMKPIRIKIRGVTSSVLDWNWREELLDEPHQPDKTHF